MKPKFPVPVHQDVYALNNKQVMRGYNIMDGRAGAYNPHHSRLPKPHTHVHKPGISNVFSLVCYGPIGRPAHVL